MTESGVSLRRVSIPYYVPTAENDYLQTRHYPRMFAEDVAEHLCPRSGDVDREPVFRLSPKDDHVSRMIETAFARIGGYGGNGRALSSILSGFGNRTARRLVHRGCETFEVAPSVDANGQTIGFSIFQVDGVWRFAGVTWQTIPKNALAGARWEPPEPVNRRLVRIPRNRVIQVRLPREYRRIPSGLRSLCHIGAALPAFAIQNLNSDGSVRVPYDPKELKGIEQRAVATITRSTGWHARGTFGDAETRYYMMRRFLRFEQFKARLRETLADTINRILAAAGAAIGITGVVSLHHLPTLEQIAASRTELATGRFDFHKAIENYSIYRRSRASSHK